jgi:hypothetical protein
VYDLVEGNIVDQAGPNSNPLLTELSRLGRIAERSANDRGQKSPSAVASERRKR